MTLAQACLMLQDLGHVAMLLHRDHCCHAEGSHTWAECPGAPSAAVSASDVAELTTEVELQELIVTKLRVRYLGARVCVECGCSDLNACPDDGSGLPCHWVSLDPPICSTCAPSLASVLP